MVPRTCRQMGLLVPLVCLVAFALTGCVSQDKYAALKLSHDALVERLSQADAEAQAAKARAATATEMVSSLGGSQDARTAHLLNLQQANADLQDQVKELTRRYEEAVKLIGSNSPLPLDLSTALNDFANQHPDLVEFDAGRGMVKFKSDVTFASGSSDLTDKARPVLEQLTQILNSEQARDYDLMVAGHTDSKPVTNPETIRKGHKDNWHLSAHRAIAVSSALQAQGVSPKRIAVVGYADQRPAASGGSEQDTQQNRRVEVLILPTTATGRPGTATASDGTGGTPPGGGTEEGPGGGSEEADPRGDADNK